MIAVLLAAAAAAEIAIPFNPPVATFRHVTVQTRMLAGQQRRFTAERRVAFEREPGGWRMEVTLIGSSTDAEGAPRAVFEAGLAPLRDVAVVYAFSAEGRPLGVRNYDDIWPRVRAGYRAIAVSTAADATLSPDVRLGVGAIVAALETAPEAANVERLLDEVRAITAYAGVRTSPDGAAALADPAGESTERLDRADAATARFVASRTTSASGTRVTETRTTDVARATGLMIEARRTRRTELAKGAAQMLDETQTLAPES